MGVEQAERQLREQLEEHFGRRLSDDEWALFKQIQRQSSPGERSGGYEAGWRWAPKERLVFFAAIGVALAGVGMLLRWGFVFSPLVRFPLGIVMLLLTSAVG